MREEVSHEMKQDRAPELKVKPKKPDLTVAYIERTPRDQGLHTLVKYDLKEKKGVGVMKIELKRKLSKNRLMYCLFFWKLIKNDKLTTTVTK